MSMCDYQAESFKQQTLDHKSLKRTDNCIHLFIDC